MAPGKKEGGQLAREDILQGVLGCQSSFGYNDRCRFGLYSQAVDAWDINVYMYL